MEWIIVFVVELTGLFFLSQVLTRNLSSFFYRVSKNKNVTIQLLSFLFLPGVIVHELAHLVVASVLFVPVGEIEFTPKLQEGGGVKLGSVAIAKTDPVRRAIIGFAPVLAGLLIIFTTFYYNPPIFLICYILFEVGNTMFSSEKDMEGALELLLTAIVVVVLLYVIGVRIDFSIFRGFFSSDITTFIKKADLFLSIPIGIDVGIIATLKLKDGRW